MSETVGRIRLGSWILLLAAMCAFVAAFAMYRQAAQHSADFDRRAQELHKLEVQTEELRAQIKSLEQAAHKSP